MTYVHHGDARLVELLYSPCRWDTNRTDEKGGLLLNNDIEKVRQLAFSVVILQDQSNSR